MNKLKSALVGIVLTGLAAVSGCNMHLTFDGEPDPLLRDCTGKTKQEVRDAAMKVLNSDDYLSYRHAFKEFIALDTVEDCRCAKKILEKYNAHPQSQLNKYREGLIIYDKHCRKGKGLED